MNKSINLIISEKKCSETLQTKGEEGLVGVSNYNAQVIRDKLYLKKEREGNEREAQA
jgi:hypothetical protein